MRASSVFALLLPLTGVLGNKHHSCDCMTWVDDGQGWRYDWELTKWVCHKSINGGKYEIASGRCVTDGKDIDGDAWEQACKDWGKGCGFYPMTSKGFSYVMRGPPLKVSEAVGHCPDRE
ncbi:hypothetical protein E4U43_000776 [Claviceps pusilla]|uniref:Uncharacterized protein n=1 Tax=Claviceps pusilla TaxID=123648 RepID=A0A9P7SYT5_9HYPO|nr:hypothetical protein E4U43_000776 [Claviceps pusilla]